LQPWPCGCGSILCFVDAPVHLGAQAIAALEHNAKPGSHAHIDTTTRNGNYLFKCKYCHRVVCCHHSQCTPPGWHRSANKGHSWSCHFSCWNVGMQKLMLSGLYGALCVSSVSCTVAPCLVSPVAAKA
jgi:hypothetical protein